MGIFITDTAHHHHRRSEMHSSTQRAEQMRISGREALFLIYSQASVRPSRPLPRPRSEPKGLINLFRAETRKKRRNTILFITSVKVNVEQFEMKNNK